MNLFFCPCSFVRKFHLSFKYFRVDIFFRNNRGEKMHTRCFSKHTHTHKVEKCVLELSVLVRQSVYSTNLMQFYANDRRESGNVKNTHESALQVV